MTLSQDVMMSLYVLEILKCRHGPGKIFDIYLNICFRSLELQHFIYISFGPKTDKNISNLPRMSPNCRQDLLLSGIDFEPLFISNVK